MTFEQTPLNDCFVMNPTVLEDDRGYFFESFNLKTFEELTGMSPAFVQDNQSRSSKGVLRGLHLQQGDHAQAKLVRVLEGEVFDVVVDLRPNSSSFKKSFSITLSEQNKKQLFVPRGFAHGFLVTSDFATIHYKTDNYYNKQSESGILFSDPELGIEWPFPKQEIKTSAKDLLLPTLKEFLS